MRVGSRVRQEWHGVRYMLRLRGSVVIDKSFVIMALACSMAPFVGAGLYMMVVLL